MRLVRAFEENAGNNGHQSLVKGSIKHSEEMGITLQLECPEPTCSDMKGNKVSEKNLKNILKMAVREERKDKVRNENWQGKLIRSRWEDEQLDQQGCFAWLRSWKDAPTHTIAGMMELYEQLTPNKLYTSCKTRTTQGDDVTCRMCGKAPESLAHV